MKTITSGVYSKEAELNVNDIDRRELNLCLIEYRDKLDALKTHLNYTISHSNSIGSEEYYNKFIEAKTRGLKEAMQVICDGTKAYVTPKHYPREKECEHHAAMKLCDQLYAYDVLSKKQEYVPWRDDVAAIIDKAKSAMESINKTFWSDELHLISELDKSDRQLRFNDNNTPDDGKKAILDGIVGDIEALKVVIKHQPNMDPIIMINLVITRLSYTIDIFLDMEFPYAHTVRMLGEYISTINTLWVDIMKLGLINSSTMVTPMTIWNIKELSYQSVRLIHHYVRAIYHICSPNEYGRYLPPPLEQIFMNIFGILNLAVMDVDAYESNEFICTFVLSDSWTARQHISQELFKLLPSIQKGTHISAAMNFIDEILAVEWMISEPRIILPAEQNARLVSLIGDKLQYEHSNARYVDGDRCDVPEEIYDVINHIRPIYENMKSEPDKFNENAGHLKKYIEEVFEFGKISCYEGKFLTDLSDIYRELKLIVLDKA